MRLGPLILLMAVALVAARCFTTHDIIVGPTWHLVEVGGTPPVADANVTFAGDGSFTGDTGCNDVSGTYHLDGNRIVLDSELVTEIGCPDVGAQEAAFLAVLEGRPTYSIDSGTGRLRLVGEDGGVLLFEAP